GALRGACPGPLHPLARAATVWPARRAHAGGVTVPPAAGSDQQHGGHVRRRRPAPRLAAAHRLRRVGGDLVWLALLCDDGKLPLRDVPPASTPLPATEPRRHAAAGAVRGRAAAPGALRDPRALRRLRRAVSKDLDSGNATAAGRWATAR